MDTINITLDEPLVDENLNSLETSVFFLERTKDEFNYYKVTINVNSLSMIPTAILFSMKKRLNTDFYVYLSDFPGSDFVYSFLKSGHIKEINRV